MNVPLKNKLFISTRPEGQSDELCRLLEAAGAETVEMPMIKIDPVVLSVHENNLVNNLSHFQWLIFTSPNGVRSFFEILKNQNSTTLPEKLQIAVIGKKTEKVLATFGYSPAFVNPGNTGEDFAVSFLQKIKDEAVKPNILLVLGNLARTVIQDELKNFADCERINVYQTSAPGFQDEKTVRLIYDNRYEMLIFTSPSAIQNFMKSKHNIPAGNLRLACIGETTADEARKLGFQPLVVAEDASAQGIVESIIQFYTKTLKR